MEISENAFLNGRVTIAQPVSGYRAGADPVFLAAATEAVPGQSVLEMGCGVGTALLCLMARIPDLRVTGVELQAELAGLAQKNLIANGQVGEIETADLTQLPAHLKQIQFDHVITNPPFFDRLRGSLAKKESREIGRGGEISLRTWLETCLRRLRPGGALTLINRIERLPECLSVLERNAGGIHVLPLAPRRSRPAKLFVLKAKKGTNGAFSLCPAFVLHDGDLHERDGDSYTQAAQNVLRKGAALPWTR